MSFPAHLVQFYEPDRFPAGSVADYFCEGLEADESSLLIATPEHSQQIKSYLERCGVDTAMLEHAGLLRILDAAETLEKLRSRYPLDDKGIDLAIGEALDRATGVAPSGCTRVFGELGNLIANDGEYAVYAQLARRWNQLALGVNVRLYCGYSITASSAGVFQGGPYEICNLQEEVAHVISAVGPKGWLALLEQRGRGLQAEIQRRKAAEETLRNREQEFAQLMDRQMAQWLEGCREESGPATLLGRPHFVDYFKQVDRLLEGSLAEILAACEDACEERRAAAPDSPEWNKATREILAYGKLTHVLYTLQAYISNQKNH